MSNEFTEDEGKECPFCGGDIKSRCVAECGTVFAVRDKYPVTEGHLLIIPCRHTEDWFTMTAGERADSESLLATLRNQVITEDSTVTGFNIGMNCGAAAGQTVMHAHIHLIPRRNGDSTDPRGGVRGVIPARMNYMKE